MVTNFSNSHSFLFSCEFSLIAFIISTHNLSIFLALAEQATDYKSAAAGTDVMESYLSYLFVHYFKLQTILLAYEFAYFLYFTVLVHQLYKVDAVGAQSTHVH